MASDINSRLAAILERHPKLRPTQDGSPLTHRPGVNVEWAWHHPDGAFPEVLYDQEAHAPIFRAMVEALPNGSEVFRTMYNQWTISGMGFWGDPNADLFDALINFYESLAAVGKEGEHG